MKFLEKDLEQIIYETENHLLNCKGLDISGIKKRQLRIGNYGISDLITVEKSYQANNKISPMLDITIFELKKNEISVSTFLQAIRYLKGIKRYFYNRNSSYRINYKIVLIGESIDINNDFIFLTDLVNVDEYGCSFSLEYYTYEMNFNGLQFNQYNGYKLSQEGFNNG